MSFPNPQAGAESGSAPAAVARGFVLGTDEGDAFWWLGSLTLNKVMGDRTQGGVDIVDHRVPAGYAPPLHVHSRQDEVFYIIDGHFSVRCGDEQWPAEPGSLVFLPRQVPHGFIVSEAGPGRTLLINTPSGFADVVSELGERTRNLLLPGPDVSLPDPGRVAAVSEAHGIHGV